MACFLENDFLARRKSYSRCIGRDRSGTAAIEFAIVAPAFLLMILGMLGFGIYLGAAHSVRQLTSDVARATIPGATEAERQMIASNFIALNVGNYAFIEIEDLEIAVRNSETVANQSVIEISYDASGLPIWGFSEFAPMPSKTITASATIVNGGYVQ